MGRRRLGLRKRTMTKCGSARRSAETDQRTKDREHGAGIGSDDISGGLLKEERHQTASVYDITRRRLGRSWDADGTQHRVADT